MSHRKELLIMLIGNLILYGEDFGITSYEAREWLECDFEISRASNILRQMHGNRLLKRKLEVFPSGGRRYRYYLTSEGEQKAYYYYKIRHPELLIRDMEKIKRKMERIMELINNLQKKLR